MAWSMKNVDEVGDKYPDFPVFIQYKGVWDEEELYQTIMDFFMTWKFKVQEKLYMKKNTAFGYESKYIYAATKRSEENSQSNVDIYFHTFDANDVEVKLPDGRVRTFTKGRIWIRLVSNTDIDPDRRWKKSLFTRQLRAFFHKYVIQKKIDLVYWDENHYKVTLKLRNIIMQRLKMETEEYEHRYAGGMH